MADSAAAVLAQTQSVLTGNIQLTALVAGRVHLAPPVNPVYPFILITCESQPYAADDFSGMEHRLRVQAIARENRPGTVLAIRRQVFAALNRQEASMALPENDLILVEQEGVFTYFPEDDGRTYQSVAEFKVLVI